ncbi:hypothetical protein [Lysinibacillus sp. BPa_S21]|nr:hypothetical protein [Lysinibacillus sp. BPa_S21]MCL1696305.1 hypothetical protein [Lysinibacillus sp. BPa_S21]
MEKILIETTKEKANQTIALLEMLKLGFTESEYYTDLINDILRDFEKAVE